MSYVLYYRLVLNGNVPNFFCPISMYCNTILTLSEFLHVVLSDDEQEEDVISYLQKSDCWTYDIEPVWVCMKGSVSE